VSFKGFPCNISLAAQL